MGSLESKQENYITVVNNTTQDITLENLWDGDIKHLLPGQKMKVLEDRNVYVNHFPITKYVSGTVMWYEFIFTYRTVDELTVCTVTDNDFNYIRVNNISCEAIAFQYREGHNTNLDVVRTKLILPNTEDTINNVVRGYIGSPNNTFQLKLNSVIEISDVKIFTHMNGKVCYVRIEDIQIGG